MPNINLVNTTQSKRTALEAYRNVYAIPVKTVADVNNIINEINQGRIQRYIEFYNYMLDRDLDISSSISSRIDRVISPTWEVTPSSNDPDDTAAAAFVSDVLDKIPDLYQRFLSIAEAIPVGFSAHEFEWKYRNGNLEVTDIMYVNPRRFIYTPQWQLRLYDYGLKGAYGEELLPNKWLIHTSLERQGDPCMYGLVRGIAYPFLFRHYTQKFWLHYSEVYGQPHILVHVAETTPDDVIEAIRTELEHWSYDHVSVVKGDTKPEITQGSNTTSVDGFERFLKWSTDSITRFILGSSDINQAGEVGSLAAVQQRATSVVDPKRNRDALAFSATIQKQLFEPLINLNMHLFTKRPTLPEFRFKYGAASEPEAESAPATTPGGQARIPFSRELAKKADWA